MICELQGERLPIKLWLADIEQGALQQARNLANLPFAVGHIALMPDCHEGYGMPIGGVLALENVVIPHAVGMDIGCGMCAVQTNLEHLDPSRLKRLIADIRARIPLGFKHHETAQDIARMPEVPHPSSLPVIEREYDKALRQLGTLGGGNHFIEIQKGADGLIWIMLHSGSRNLGKQVADYYNHSAIQLNTQWRSPVPRAAQLAYLPLDTPQGQSYMQEMQYCIDFAFANRRLMMDRILEVFEDHQKGTMRWAPMINIAHNYAAKEQHLGRELIIHRKGATLASEDTIGIIPGSQGTQSFIVKGKGNPDSFHSCSHGAGRIMGRKQAQRSLNLQDEIARLDKQGILHAIRHQNDLDEAAGAYKDICQVMKNQQDLVEVLLVLSPLAVIKG